MLAKKIENLKPSLTLELTEKISILRKEGKDVIALNVGEPDFPTPKHISEKAKEAIDKHMTKYTAAAGIVELRQAICRKLEKDNLVQYTPEEICVGTGAKQPLLNAILALCEEGDEVIIPAPCWFSYIEMVKMVGAVPIVIQNKESEGFALNLKEVEKAISPKTKAILINTPNNPTGAVYTKEVLTKLGELAKKHNFYIISDEVYEKLVYGNHEHFCVASVSEEVKSRTVVINGFSKAYAMTGWRVGYAAAPKEIIKGIAAIQGHSTSNACTISQIAALEALQSSQDCVEEMRAAFDERRKFLQLRLRKMPDITCTEAEGAFYLMANVSRYYGMKWKESVISNSYDMANYLLENAHIAVAPGGAFGADDHIRIAYANSLENLEIGMNRMEEALKNLYKED